MTILPQVLLLLVLTSSCSKACKCQCRTFWVTPSAEHCISINSTPCDTIDGYLKQKSNIFSTSNATWNFLEGTHHFLLKKSLYIKQANNINLYGTGLGSQLVNITLRIENCSNVNISKLNISQSTVALYSVHDLSISTTTFQRSDLTLGIPSGSCKVKHCNFRDGKLQMLQYLKYNYNAFSLTLYLLIYNSTFDYNIESQLEIISTSMVTYNHTEIIVENCSLADTSITTTTRHLKGSLSIKLSNCQFTSNNIVFNLLPLGSSRDIKLDIAINNCKFKSADGKAVLIAFLIYYTVDHSIYFTPNNQQSYQIPNITVNNTTFQGAAVLVRNFANVNQKSTYPMLTFNNCTFSSYGKNRIKETYIGAHITEYVLVLLNLWFPVLLSDVKFTNNVGGAIHMSMSSIQSRGYNEISDNVYQKGGDVECNGIVRISGHGSRILLEENSVFSITNNSGSNYASLLYVPLQTVHGHFETLVTNLIGIQWDNKCFIQLIKDGEFLNRKDLNDFKGSLVIHNTERGSQRSFNIFNMHLFNCHLHTQNGDYDPITIEELKTIIDVDSWNGNSVASVPHICLRDDKNPDDQSLWDCGESSNLTLSPGQNVILNVTILKDINQTYYKKFKLKAFLINQKVKKYTISENFYVIEIPNREITRMTEITLSIDLGKRSHTCYDRTYVPPFSTHHVYVLQCPMGFKGDKTTMKCDCSTFLKRMGFMCLSTDQTSVFFNNSLTYRWIDWQPDKVRINTYCYYNFCNRKLRYGGIIIKTAKLESAIFPQCKKENNRVGFGCSECPKDYSSVFGGYKCTKCKGPWFLFFIPLYASFGLLLIASLFLFNLTIVQGTINGISLYANIMYLYEGHFYFDKGRNFQRIISFLNFGSGFESCFYDGMDEFAKTILQYFFPFYLLLLVVLIIIGAHKFNFRIFKVEFIAKRAVPVLATLMVLTYTSLLGIVRTSLGRNALYTLYPNDQFDMTLVWLYQPKLTYFKGKHLVLGLLAIAVTIFYLIPLTVVTLFGDLLRRNCIRSLWFSHFLDVFHGAYRWPLGFWLGLRLLMRVIFLVLQVATKFNTVYTIVFISFCIFFILEILIIKPFHKRFYVSSFSKPQRKGLKSKLAGTVEWMVNPVNSDSLFILNIIMFTSIRNTISSFHSSDQNGVDYREVFLIFLIVGAIIQMIVIVAFHGWMYFPLPKCVKERWLKCKQLFSRHTAKQNDQEPSTHSAEHYIDQFPFHHIHHLVAGLPDENESSTSDEEETSLSAEDRKGISVESAEGLTDQLLQK